VRPQPNEAAAILERYVVARRTLRIDKKQLRKLYRLLPWRNRALTMVQLQVPGESDPKKKHTIRALAATEDEFVDLIVHRPPDISGRPRDVYVCTNPISGNVEDYFPSSMARIGNTRWPSEGPVKKLNADTIVEYRMLGFDIDGPDLATARPILRRLIDALKPNSYLPVQTARGFHVWMPLPPETKLPGQATLHDHVCDQLGLDEDERALIDDQPFASFAVLRVPGTWHTKDEKSPIFVKIATPNKIVRRNKPNRHIADALTDLSHEESPAKFKNVLRRRIVSQAPKLANADTTEKWFNKEFVPLLVEPDGRIHLFRLPPGLGKSRNTQIALDVLSTIGRRSLYLAPRHILLQEFVDRLGDNAAKMPVLDQEQCGDLYGDALKAKDSGFLFQVCRQCPNRGKKRGRYICQFHQDRHDAADATILFAPSAHIKTPRFWQDDNPGHDRPLVVIDESVLDIIQETCEVGTKTLRNLSKKIDLAYKKADDKTRPILFPFRAMLKGLVKFVGGPPRREYLKRIMSRRADPREFEETEGGYIGRFVPHEWSPELAEIIQKAVRAASRRIGWKHLARLRELTTSYRRTGGNLLVHKTKRWEDGVPVTSGIRFFIRHDLPKDRTYILLDATTDPYLLKQHFGDRFQDHPMPTEIEPVGRVTQVMDWLYGKRQILKQITRLRKTSRKPAIVRLIDHITEELVPKAKKIGLISHLAERRLPGEKKPLALVVRILEMMAAQDRVAAVGHFGNLRGTNTFEGCDLLLVVGTPRIPPDVVAQTAAAFNYESRSAKIIQSKEWRTLRDDCAGEEWRVRTYWPDQCNPTQVAVHKSQVEGELVQAIGRARIIRNDTPVYVLTNELIDLPGIRRVFSSDLDDDLSAEESQTDRRKDEREEYYDEFVGFVNELLKEGPVYPKRIADRAKGRDGLRFDRETITSRGPNDEDSHWDRFVAENSRKLGRVAVRGGAHAYRLGSKKRGK